jgi:glycosyltransferase involved in cell wall biosynthesis
MGDGITVIVCCFNSSSRISQTLQYLGRQKLSESLSAEILLVDNGSSDDTIVASKTAWEANKHNRIKFRVTTEATPGLAAAREKGIAESQFEYIVFCDDDNWLEEDYLQNVYMILSGSNELAAVGGNNKGVFEVTPPAWIINFQSSYAIGEQGVGEYQELEGSSYLVGAGLGFKKSVYRKAIELGYHFYLTDRIGTKVVGGGDVELSYIFKLCGYKIAYSSSLELNHYMPPNRITKKYLVNMWHNYPQSWLVFEAYKTLLNNEFTPEKLRRGYWLKFAISQLISKSRLLRFLLSQKWKGNIQMWLPLETELMYKFYLLRNSQAITSILRDLHKKVSR